MLSGPRWYILDENDQPLAATIDGYYAWLRERGGEATRIVEKTKIGQAEVSTVFLGLDHRIGGNGPPILWETMIFGEEDIWDEYQERYTSLKAAKLGHKRQVWRLRASLQKELPLDQSA